MSKTLNFVACLADRGRKYQQFGLTQAAAQCWTRLAGLGEIPADVEREAQTCLAEFHLDRRKFARARRHLTAALTHQPGNAHLHYLMAAALEADGKGDRRQALAHYRRAVELQPEEPQYQCSFGLLSVDYGDIEEGLACLCRALELAPNDAEIVEQVAHGLEQEDREEARAVLRSALFRNPKDARFHKLWSDFHFRSLHADQARGRRGYPEEEGPVLLPFLAVGANLPHVRRDAPSRRARPHFHLPATGKKHA